LLIDALARNSSELGGISSDSDWLKYEIGRVRAWAIFARRSSLGKRNSVSIDAIRD
jgi:hypothetical protein